ncbi:MAG: CinA family protein [Methylococcales symbiont of Iophon sp. n. MRB-2018]|nr:MAG: CinA family protein [Methylococcales symbiont of Iophon sp. n. MRB-2018]KAF3980205.1 MAG: CinA family protein [Methylococcales symbiont of Iophon sp. n. MRB-2018]
MDKELVKLARQLGESLKHKGLKLVTAESCTGGGLAQAITDIAGSSAWFDRGFITYSNQSKIEMLQVKQVSLEKYGAVSKQVALEMIDGALENSDADIAVAVTGIAGPTGGSEQKPVGTVYIAFKIKNKKKQCVRRFLLGDRGNIRKQVIKDAMFICLHEVFDDGDLFNNDNVT